MLAADYEKKKIMISLALVCFTSLYEIHVQSQRQMPFNSICRTDFSASTDSFEQVLFYKVASLIKERRYFPVSYLSLLFILFFLYFKSYRYHQLLLNLCISVFVLYFIFMQYTKVQKLLIFQPYYHCVCCRDC